MAKGSFPIAATYTRVVLVRDRVLGMWNQERHGAVIVATYTDPPMNYYRDAAFGQLDELIDGWMVDDAAAIVLTGGVEGRFITHFDVDEILRTQEEPDGIFEAPARSRRAQALTLRLHGLPQPVIAAMNGDTMGFGYELSLACDLRIAQRGDFRIGLPEVRLGITPAGSGLTRLTKLVGRARALELILRARVVTPEEALALGMVTELADDARASAIAVAQELAAMVPLAVAMAKKAIYQVADLPLELALTLEVESSFRLKQSPDIQAPMREYLALPLEQRRRWLEGSG
jgi:enoyl-CoA hydratase/carnithine racemase